MGKESYVYDMDVKQPLIASPDVEQPATVEELATRVEEARTSAFQAQRDLFSAQREYRKAWGKTRRGRISMIVFFSFLFAITALPMLGLGYLIYTDDEVMEEYLPRRIPLEAHIMSKCPDARDCLHDLVLPAMVNVSNYVDFKLSYIGT